MSLEKKNTRSLIKIQVAHQGCISVHPSVLPLGGGRLLGLPLREGRLAWLLEILGVGTPLNVV